MTHLEEIIRNNKDAFEKDLTDRHEQKFLVKLSNRFKHLISIVPYLIRVFIVTIIVFIGSIIIWNNYIRKDRHEVTLTHKVYNIIHTLR